MKALMSSNVTSCPLTSANGNENKLGVEVVNSETHAKRATNVAKVFAFRQTEQEEKIPSLKIAQVEVQYK